MRLRPPSLGSLVAGFFLASGVAVAALSAYALFRFVRAFVFFDSERAESLTPWTCD